MKDSVCAKPRQTNIELLRILSMFLVLMIHYNVITNGMPNQEMVVTTPMRAWGISLLSGLDFICVDCFLVISGYFGIHWKWKSIASYLFQLSFWSAFVYIACSLLGYHAFSASEFAHITITALLGNWFFMCYLGVYVLAPVMNTFAEKCDTKQMGYVLLAFFMYQTIFGYVLKARVDLLQGLNILNLCGFYLLGAYLKKCDLKWSKFPAWVDLSIYLGIAFFLSILSVVTKYFGATKDVFSYISPFAIVQSAYLFLFFKKIPVGRWEKTILFFSTSAFAVLLMHSWAGAGAYFDVCRLIHDHLPVPFLFVLLFMMLFFVVAVFVDKVRMWLFEKIIGRFL